MRFCCLESASRSVSRLAVTKPRGVDGYRRPHPAVRVGHAPLSDGASTGQRRGRVSEAASRRRLGPGPWAPLTAPQCSVHLTRLLSADEGALGSRSARRLSIFRGEGILGHTFKFSSVKPVCDEIVQCLLIRQSLDLSKDCFLLTFARPVVFNVEVFSISRRGGGDSFECRP